jgi:hypothetical protein
MLLISSPEVSFMLVLGGISWLRATGSLFFSYLKCLSAIDTTRFGETRPGFTLYAKDLSFMSATSNQLTNQSSMTANLIGWTSM